LVDNVKHVAIRHDDAGRGPRYAARIIEIRECRTQIMSIPAKDRSQPADPSSQAKGAPSDAGRIVHDARGNAVWNWNKGSDPGSTATTSKMLRKLDLENLRVEDDVQGEKQADPRKRGSGYGPGYNPYDRTAPVRATPPKKRPEK
jgi:hypothetical protein